jgi:hypothetical protein
VIPILLQELFGEALFQGKRGWDFFHVSSGCLLYDPSFLKTLQCSHVFGQETNPHHALFAPIGESNSMSDR